MLQFVFISVDYFFSYFFMLFLHRIMLCGYILSYVILMGFESKLTALKVLITSAADNILILMLIFFTFVRKACFYMFGI